MGIDTIKGRLEAAGWTEADIRNLAVVSIGGMDVCEPSRGTDKAGKRVVVKDLLPPGTTLSVGEDSGVVTYSKRGYIALLPDPEPDDFEAPLSVLRLLIEVNAIV